MWNYVSFLLPRLLRDITLPNWKLESSSILYKVTALSPETGTWRFPQSDPHTFPASLSLLVPSFWHSESSQWAIIGELYV